MDKLISALKRNIRLTVQVLVTAVSNGYAVGFVQGKIFRGKLKGICVPGLNCYSCPGALGSCPIGSLQAVLGSAKYQMSFYIVGFFMVVGALVGRFVCGWLCPFGLVQDLIYKIPFVKKLKKLPGDRWLKFLKYVILIGFVILLPLYAVNMVGQGDPWFCKYICPSGTLMGGLPLVLANPSLRSAIGWLFAWKNAVLIVLVLLSVVVYRPFCKYLCPLGAIYGLFNPIAFYRFHIDEEKCTKCKVCQTACPADIPVYQNPNSMECIRCGKCKKACPHGAIVSRSKKKPCHACPAGHD